MKKVSASIDEEHAELLSTYQEENNVDSRSAALREILDKYEELRTECEGLRTECEELRKELEERKERVADLEDQLRRRSQIEEEIEALPDKIRQGTQSYRDRKERLIDQASLGKRLKWKVTGVPVDELTDGEAAES